MASTIDHSQSSARSAVGSGRARNLHQQAQAVAASLRELPSDPSADAVAFSGIQELARLVWRLQESARGLQDPEQRAMWEQRATWMHEELIALTAERLQGGGPEAYWGNLVGLLYSGAAASEQLAAQAAAAESEAEAARASADAARAEAVSLEERLASHQKASSSHSLQNGHAAGAGAEEALELRTKLVVAQQEVQRRVADARDMTQRLQAALAERDNWKRQCQTLQAERTAQREESESQAQVIAALMAKSEAAQREASSLLASSSELKTHNRALSVNLENHARVVEQLIALNSELMDAVNIRAAMADRAAAAGGGEGHAAGMGSGVNGVGSPYGNGPPPPPLPPMPPAPLASMGSRGLPLSTHAWQGPLSTGPSLTSEAVLENHIHPPASQKDSLTDAFEAFLKGEEPGQPGGGEGTGVPHSVIKLEQPLEAPRPGPDLHTPRPPAAPRRGFGAVLSKAATLALYVAGNDAAVRERAQQLGEDSPV